MPKKLLARAIQDQTGCGKSGTSDPSQKSGNATPETIGAAGEAGASKSTKKIIPVKRDVKTFDGNWVMVVSSQGRDNFMWIVRFTKDTAGKLRSA